MNKTKYSDLVDVPKLQALMTSFNEVIGIANAVIDVDGTVIARAGWQDACTGYHRLNPESCRRCIESDTSLAESMMHGSPYAIYRCMNGLVDAAAPIIVEGLHLANVFTGQFLTEAADLEMFRRQARQFEFDELGYLEAISRVPVLPLEQAEALTRLYAQLAGMLADSGADRLAKERAARNLVDLNSVLEGRVEQRTLELRESENRFRLMFERNDSVMLLIEPASGAIVDANVAAANFYGYPVERLKAMRISEINTLSPEKIAEERLHAANHQRNSFVFPHRIASGEIRTVEVRSSPIEVGRRVLLFSIVQDITARVRAETVARESDERLRLAMAAANQGWFDVDLVTGSVAVSSEYVRMLGYEPDEFRSDLSTWLASVHPEDRDGLWSVFQACTRNGGPASMEYRRSTKSGEWKWIESVGRIAQWDAEHRATRMIGIHMDITQRKQLEDTLRARTAELSAIIEAEPECVKQLAADGTLLQMNKAGLEMIEADSLSQVLGKRVQQLVVPAHRRAFNALTRRVFAGKSGRLEFEIRGLKGGHRWLETRSVPLRDAKGQITAMLGVTRDITQSKKMGDQVRQLAFFDPLTQLPNRRLLNDRLKQSLAANKRSHCYGALMFLDLDNFKPLNDTHGHEVGDLLLIEAAGRLKSCVREMDTVARFGGDEFVVILNNLTPGRSDSARQAQIVAEKIRDALSEPYRLTVKGNGQADVVIEHRCTASIGVALFVDHESNYDEILKCADSAMYQAKVQGRNAIRFHDAIGVAPGDGTPLSSRPSGE